MTDIEQNEAQGSQEEANQGGDHSAGLLLIRVIRGKRRVLRARDLDDLRDRGADEEAWS